METLSVSSVVRLQEVVHIARGVALVVFDASGAVVALITFGASGVGVALVAIIARGVALVTFCASGVGVALGPAPKDRGLH